VTTAYEWMAGLLDVIGSGVANTHTEAGRRLRQCPAHVDRSPSLSIRPGPGGSVRLNCFTGCGQAAILAALRCSRARLAVAPRVSPADYARMTRLWIDFPPVEVKRHGHPGQRGFRLEAVHNYGPAALERWRSGTHKELLWETCRPDGSRIPGLFGVTLADLPLYREAEVRQGIALGEPVLLVESESSVDALRGWHATTWAGGAPAINVARIGAVLGGYPHTVVIPDNDPAGRRWHARLTAAGLAPHTLWPADGCDARDLYRHLGPDGFTRAVQNAMRTMATAGRVA
jgi:hypothetical protein